MVQAGERSFLIVQGQALAWSPAGYRKPNEAIERVLEANERAMLLTPPSTLRAFSAGYRPLLHQSARWMIFAPAMTERQTQ
jgi:hypothetical protein